MIGGVSYATGEPWTGRTKLNDSPTAVRSRLAAKPTFAAERTLELLNELDQHTDQSLITPSPIEAPEVPSWLGAGFQGWSATPPPKPYYTSPLPLSLELPIGAEPPLAELQPWWNQLVLDGAASAAPIASHVGRHVRIGQWGRLGWESGSAKYFQADHGEFDVHDSHLNAWGRAKETNPRISGPGFVGSFVPGYAEVREFASSMSEQTDYFVFGCRVDFAFVSAVTLHLEWNRSAPLLSAPLKELVKRRGYGELQEASIGVELTDGWHPWRIQLMQDAGGSKTEEVEQRIIAFAQWLVRVISSHRQRQPYVAAHLGPALDDLAANPRQLSEHAGSKTHREWFRCSIPASRPVSWRSSL